MMLKRAALFIVSGLLMFNLCGCFAIVAGVAGGAGTAVWLSGKLTQEFHAPYHQVVDATQWALKSLHLTINKETQEDKITQIKGLYSNGKEMWIDISKISDRFTRVEVRVGVVNSDKEAAGSVLKKIQSYL